MARSRVFVDSTREGRRGLHAPRMRLLGQLGKKTRLERWRDHHAWADMQGGKWKEELYQSGEMTHGGVEMA